MRTKLKGFTLGELMITVAIVGILMAVAVPTYTNYVIRSNRTDALDTLNIILEAQERYYGDNRTYTVDLSDLGMTPDANGDYYSVKSLYILQVARCGVANLTVCVEITARGVGSQLSDGSIIFNSRGEKYRLDGANNRIDI